MLTELHIRNLAVIEAVRLTFYSGFQVLTGETGAGKSIIIDALGLIAGGRASSDLVRHGSEKAEIEAVFHEAAEHPVWQVLAGLGIEPSADDSIMIRRDVTAAGKSSGRINGQLVNQSMLKEVGEWLVNIHGQHEHQSLLRVESHIEWLDLFGGAEIHKAQATYTDSYSRYMDLRKQLKDLVESGKQGLQMQDLYRFQTEEIRAAKLKPGEEVTLHEERKRLANAEKLYAHVNESYELLFNEKGLEAVSKAMQRLQEISSLDGATLSPLQEQISSSYYQLEDAAFQLRDYRDQIEFNPERIDEIERRLDTIATLRRKYGDSTQDILAYLTKIEHELSLIENKDEHVERLRAELAKEQTVLTGRAIKLHELREKAAKSLAKQIEHELLDLQMERTRFSVQLEADDDPDGPDIEGRLLHLGPLGYDRVEFLISANPGEPLRSLSRIASGGEMSRIMLAMKSIFAKVDNISVLIFDEVDTGVSGRAAQAIAEKLSRLSHDSQIFSITHLPQVACMADEHYLIQKGVEGSRTFTRVHHLDDEGRILELARMLGGVEVTETTKRHAQEMIVLARQKKRQA